MFCKFCGEKIEKDTIFCSKCGEKLTNNERTDVASTEITDEQLVGSNKNEESIKKSPNKTLGSEGKSTPSLALYSALNWLASSLRSSANIIQKIIFSCLIAGIVGFSLFIGIVLVGLIAYGRIYLFDGYEFTKVLSIISIVLMMIGLCSVIVKSALFFILKIGTFPTTIIKRILVIALAVACLGFSIWGFVDCSNNNYSGGGSSSYWSFYTVYNECSCSYPWAEVGTDYLSIDTNPYDYDSDSSSSTTYASKALSAIRSINRKLSLPSYLYNEMLETRALDGRQSYSGTKVNVSWRYHPDSGLEVRYTKKQNY